jgi:hypothetical protein
MHQPSGLHGFTDPLGVADANAYHYPLGAVVTVESRVRAEGEGVGPRAIGSRLRWPHENFFFSLET